MAGDLAKQAILDGADLILALGGDGTINEIVNGMAHSGVPLGILPAGTANVLAMELGLGGNAARAIPKIAECAPERISLGRLRNANGERYFICMAGVGLDAEIVYNINADLKKAIGKVAYWIAGFSHLTKRIAEFQTAVGGERRKVGFALASRVRNYGGDLTIASGANLLEHEFETILFDGGNPLRYMVYFLGVAIGTLPRMNGITIDHSRRLEFDAPTDRRIYVQVDGEYAGHLPATIEIVDQSLTLLVPADFRERLGLKLTEALMPAAG